MLRIPTYITSLTEHAKKIIDRSICEIKEPLSVFMNENVEGMRCKKALLLLELNGTLAFNGIRYTLLDAVSSIRTSLTQTD